jgi:hypothetical protein
MSNAFELVPALLPPTIYNLRQGLALSSNSALDLTPGINCVVFEAATSIRMIAPGIPLAGSLVPFEAQAPFLMSVPRSEPRLMMLSSIASSRVWAYVAAVDDSWTPMAAPSYVGTYPATTTQAVYDLGVTSRAEVYITPSAPVLVVFGSTADDLSSVSPFPVYPSSPMRFKLTAESRRMAIQAASGSTTVTVTFVGKSS